MTDVVIGNEDEKKEKRNGFIFNNLDLICKSVLNLMKWKSVATKDLKNKEIDEGGRKRCKTDESNEENELIGNVMIRVCDTKMRDRKQRNA